MITNQHYIKNFITTNDGIDVPYRWTHGATVTHLGDGLLVYSIIQHMRAKVCVCIGSGGGYIPRIMTQARVDLWEQGIFSGDRDMNWGDIGVTYVVDVCNGVGGNTDLEDENSFYRQRFHPRFIKETSERAYYDFFVKHDIKIDALFIDGDHSYEGVKTDFELYSKLLNKNGVIFIHDTDESYGRELIISEDARKDFYPFDGPSKFVKELNGDKNWNVLNLFNNGIIKDKPTSTGITIVNKK
jgi:hypothetical protein